MRAQGVGTRDGDAKGFGVGTRDGDRTREGDLHRHTQQGRGRGGRHTRWVHHGRGGSAHAAHATGTPWARGRHTRWARHGRGGSAPATGTRWGRGGAAHAMEMPWAWEGGARDATGTRARVGTRDADTGMSRHKLGGWAGCREPREGVIHVIRRFVDTSAFKYERLMCGGVVQETDCFATNF